MKFHLFFTIVLNVACGVGCTSQTTNNSQSSGSTGTATPVIEDTASSIDPIDAASIEPVATPLITDVDVTVAEPTDAPMFATLVVDAGRTRPSTTRPNTRPSSNPVTPATTVQPASSTATEGQVIFDRTCGRCHPGGNARIGPRLAARADTEAHVRTVVRNGEGTMRPIPTSRVSDGDLVKVFAYLRAIRAVR